MKKVHFIAIAGNAMHNLAIALHKKGFIVTGSDNELLDPAKSRLEKHGLLPEQIGWFPEKITPDVDAVILGMHARIDNPELIATQNAGIKIYSYPEFLYEHSKDKVRIVIGGSHGKTTTTSLIMHVLKKLNVNFDFMVGALLDGFDTMVRLTSDAKYIILEGDEYLSSAIDRRPKFHLYHPHVAVLTGIAWDHINVFTEYEDYLKQFEIYINLIEKDGKLIYCSDEPDVNKVVNKLTNSSVSKIPYSKQDAITENGETLVIEENKKYKIGIFGEHNLKNISAAKLVCKEMGISSVDFFNALSDFKGAAKRLELLATNAQTSVYLDFAHSPSKLTATTEAMRKQYPQRKLVACMELHTFSSLNKRFLKLYKNTMKSVDIPIIYYNQHTIKHKKLEDISDDMVKAGFKDERLKIFTDSNLLVEELKKYDWKDTNLLMMSSGNFNGIDIKQLAEEITAS